MRRTGELAAALLGCTLAAACSSPDRAAARYDFGAPAPAADTAADTAADAAAAPSLSGVYVQVFEPAWLDTASIVYRLGYDDVDRVRSYALSQWVAAPAVLLQQRLRVQLGLAAVPAAFAGFPATGSANAPRAGLLRVDLEEFDQVFDAPQSSRVRLSAKVSLVDVVHGMVRAQRHFSIERRAPSADAQGAVHGLRDAVDGFGADVQAWVRTLVVTP